MGNTYLFHISFHLYSTSLNVYRNNYYTCQLHSQRNTSTIGILKYFSDLFKKTEFDIACKLSPKEIDCIAERLRAKIVLFRIQA